MGKQNLITRLPAANDQSDRNASANERQARRSTIMAQDDIRLRLAETDADTVTCWPLMRLLRPQLTSVNMFAAQVARQRSNGYRLLVAWEGSEAAALAGWRVQENFVYGSYLYVDDLVTRPESRGRGLGSQLLAKLGDEGRRLGCSRLVLDTATTNTAAQRFYTREGLRNQALGFSTTLSNASVTSRD